MNNEKSPSPEAQNQAATPHIYNVDKMKFIVTPAHKESGKSIHDLILKLMIKDGKNH